MNELDTLRQLALRVQLMRELQREAGPGEWLVHREIRKSCEDGVDRLLVEWLYLKPSDATPEAEGGGL